MQLRQRRFRARSRLAPRLSVLAQFACRLRPRPLTPRRKTAFRQAPDCFGLRRWADWRRLDRGGRPGFLRCCSPEGRLLRCLFADCLGFSDGHSLRLGDGRFLALCLAFGFLSCRHYNLLGPSLNLETFGRIVTESKGKPTGPSPSADISTGRVQQVAAAACTITTTESWNRHRQRSQHRNQIAFSSFADYPSASHGTAFGQLIDMPVYRFTVPHMSYQPRADSARFQA